MKPKYNVRWSDVSERDLDAVIDFIAEDNVDEAMIILERLQKKVLSLTVMPERGRIVPELRDQGIFTYRELISEPWRIIYRIAGDVIYVLAVFDSRRNLEDILLDRFIY